MTTNYKAIKADEVLVEDCELVQENVEKQTIPRNFWFVLPELSE